MRPPTRGAVVAATATACAALLAACADRAPDPAAPPRPSSATSAAPSSAAPPPTTAALPGMPVPVSVGSSPVDSARLRSIDDLPSVFQCPSSVPPIRIPASPSATGTAGATAPQAPDAIVCASALADQEAVYLWYTPTPEAKIGALTEALARTKYVHGGPNWVAAGMVNPTLGRIGGEVYR